MYDILIYLHSNCKNSSILKHYFLKYLSLIALIIAVAISCEERNLNTNEDATLQFSMDTVSFDTVFTSVGSATMHFIVHNPYNKDLEINSIYLEGGSESNFRINIDGAPELSVSDKLLRERDSMYIFIDVTVDPNKQNIPFLIEDNIVFNTNGKEQKVLLQAYGQDAWHFDLKLWKGDIGFQINDSTTNDTTFFLLLEHDTLLKADKPYYLQENLLITEGVELKLSPGVEFYIHKDKSIYIQGSLKSEGTKEAPVVFRGDRLDNLFADIPYDKVPGQWGSIALQSTSYDNTFTHTNIRNGLTGLYVDSLSLNNNPKALLKNCRIENMTYAAIYGKTGDVEAENSVFANCAERLLVAHGGGKYEFTNCTFANYYRSPDGTTHKEESVVLTNYIIGKDAIYISDLQKAHFTNCIIDGTIENELALLNIEDEKPEVTAEFNYTFDHCMIKTDVTEIDTTQTTFNNVLWNKKALFISPTEEWDFHLDTLSAAIDAGIDTYLNADIDNINYQGNPDLGAYEFIGAKE